jgi:hypothetical protein
MALFQFAMSRIGVAVTFRKTIIKCTSIMDNSAMRNRKRKESEK